VDHPSSAFDAQIERFVESCRRLGLKATHQRIEVFREIIQSDEHPDAETLFQRVRTRIPSLSRNTVYSTLQLLLDQGFIATLGLPSDRRRFEGNLEPHHHLVCTSCGKVQDFSDPECLELKPLPQFSAWGAVESVHVELRGTCSECLNRLEKI